MCKEAQDETPVSLDDPDIRREKVLEVRRALSDGSFRLDEKIEEVAERVCSRLGQ